MKMTSKVVKCYVNGGMVSLDGKDVAISKMSNSQKKAAGELEARAMGRGETVVKAAPVETKKEHARDKRMREHEERDTGTTPRAEKE
jgi:hypothetical protein